MRRTSGYRANAAETESISERLERSKVGLPLGIFFCILAVTCWLMGTYAVQRVNTNRTTVAAMATLAGITLLAIGALYLLAWAYERRKARKKKTA